MKFWRVLWHLLSVRKDRPADAYTTQWVQNAFEN